MKYLSPLLAVLLIIMLFADDSNADLCITLATLSVIVFGLYILVKKANQAWGEQTQLWDDGFTGWTNTISQQEKYVIYKDISKKLNQNTHITIAKKKAII